MVNFYSCVYLSMYRETLRVGITESPFLRFHVLG